MQSMLNKRAELTTTTIVTTIVLIASFVIILYVIFGIGFNTYVDDEACHQSVILRGSVTTALNAQDYIPLKCRTKKICITAGLFGGECSDFENSDGVTYVKVKSEADIEKFVAQDIVKCWRTMGEGKVSIFSQWLAQNYGVGGTVYPSCVVCDRIAFDKSGLEKNGIDLSKVDVQNYMDTRAVPDTNISYTTYLGGENGKVSIDLSSIKVGERTKSTNSDEFVENEENLYSADSEFASATSSTLTSADDAQLAILFMQISSPKHGESAMNIGKLALVGVAGSFTTTPALATRASYSAIRACATPPGAIACAAIGAVLGLYQQGSVAYNRAVTAGYCGDVSTGSDARDGCSVVRTTTYDAKSISQYCSVIESIS